MASESSSNAERAGEILVHLGNAGVDGMSLQALALALGDAKSATRRALVALSKRGFVEPAARYGHYRLGPAIFGLANRTTSVTELVRRYRPAVTEVAAITQQSSYLMVRAGFDAICVDMHEGTAFVQTLTGGIGGRVPLGIGPGTVSILTLLDDPLALSILDHNAPRFGQYNRADMAKVTRELDRARALGFSYDIGETYPDAGGVAVPIVSSRGNTAAAVSIAIPASLLTQKRAEEIAGVIRAAIGKCAPA
ncbi:IclR family transcriptional regulator [Arsenicitalea aurantiaca]|uniref:IclR family transcriptional regulator n=1 Tax=Arsenicitalea aurantiaca TaxID=1783274 RepID=A0A433X7Q8_9HYPH|nr:IclR family transcriptional regulator [Arsenicitalea aurantiaca]RUT30104.1 IclR family transcriptional regulator [Arsenicitalea aurantiaca]